MDENQDLINTLQEEIAAFTSTITDLEVMLAGHVSRNGEAWATANQAIYDAQIQLLRDQRTAKQAELDVLLA